MDIDGHRALRRAERIAGFVGWCVGVGYIMARGIFKNARDAARVVRGAR